MAEVVLQNVSKNFSSTEPAVDDVSLTVAEKEFLVLVGPSGCGKSTTLRLIAGLETLSAGEIRIGDHVVNDVPPKDRDIAMVFQNYALYPHMSVYKNMAFGLELRFGGGLIRRGLIRIFRTREAEKLSKLRRGIDDRVRQAAQRLEIEHLLNRKPHQLSGGERQRVALGRALVREPAAFLFDEPLSNLDAKLRQQMRVELKRLHRELNATMIYVTHDQIEALTLGDRVAVMNHGKIQQVAPPMELYQQPANLFVAQFIGATPINLEKGKLTKTETKFEFRSDRLKLKLTDKRLASLEQVPENVTLGFRAEAVNLSQEKTTENDGTIAKIITIEQLGDSAVAYLETSGVSGLWVARLENAHPFRVGENVTIQLDPEQIQLFDTDSETSIWKDLK